MKKFYQVSTPWINQTEKKKINNALKNNEISGFFGKYIPEFEKKFSKFCKTKYAITVNSGTTALHLALVSLGIKKGDEVIVSSLTNMASVFAILYIGAIPIPIDIEDDTYNLDADLIENKITKKTKAILAVHLFGHPAEMGKILKISRKYNLKVIEDCAEAHGALYKNKVVGSIGDAGCFSFYANKIITTGEGGMITFHSKKFALKAKNLKELAFGKKNKFMHSDIGFNYRMTNLQAALGCAQMTKIKSIINKKIKLAKLYKKYLGKNKLIKLPITKKNIKNVFWMFCIKVPSLNSKKRKKLLKKLFHMGIETREMFIPYNLQKFYLNKEKINCPKANKVAFNSFYIPSGIDLKESDIKYISSCLNKLIQ